MLSLQDLQVLIKKNLEGNPHILYLDNLISSSSSTAIQKALENLPNTLTHASLANNELYDYPWKNLAKIFSLLPLSVISIDLSSVEFGGQSAEDLKKAFGGLGTTLKSVNLASNSLCLLGSDLHIALNGLPQSVNFINLSGNELNKLGVDGLKIVLRSLPTHINFIDLSNNNLGQFTAEEIISILETIPSHVTHINLKANRLFIGKSQRDIDGILELKNTTPNRYDLENNGALDYVHARSTLKALVGYGFLAHPKDKERQRLPIELAGAIVNHLLHK